MNIELLGPPANSRKTAFLQDHSIKKLYRSITIIALFNFFIVSLIGVLLRAFPLFTISFPSFKNLLHAHSHFAFGGWVMPALLAVILKYFPEITGQLSLRHLKNIYLMMLISAYGMLLSFPLQGYAFVSIVFSSLSILSGFYLAYIFWLGTNHYKQQTPVRFLRAGLVYLTISALGPFATGPIIATGHAGSSIYFNSIYFYLHFQYNGWFTFAILAIVYKIIKKETRAGTLAFNLMNISCAPAFALSMLWNQPGIVYNITGGIAAVVQLVAVSCIVYDLAGKSTRLRGNRLIQLAMIFFVFKNILQFAGSFPDIANLAYRERNLTIAYLHMVLLGFVTLFLLGAMTHEHRIRNNIRLKVSITIFVVCFIVSEILLCSNAAGYDIAIGTLRFHSLLLLVSAILPLSIFMIWKEINSIQMKKE